MEIDLNSMSGIEKFLKAEFDRRLSEHLPIFKEQFSDESDGFSIEVAGIRSYYPDGHVEEGVKIEISPCLNGESKTRGAFLTFFNNGLNILFDFDQPHQGATSISFDYIARRDIDSEVLEIIAAEILSHSFRLALNQREIVFSDLLDGALWDGELSYENTGAALNT